MKGVGGESMSAINALRITSPLWFEGSNGSCEGSGEGGVRISTDGRLRGLDKSLQRAEARALLSLHLVEFCELTTKQVDEIGFN